MGKKDKHKLGQTRNNPVFKVATGKVSKQKGKAKEVTTKLKNVSGIRYYVFVTLPFYYFFPCF